LRAGFKGSEPTLLEQLRCNLLFRWFVGLGMDDPIWDVSSFSKNRDRFLGGEISAKFFASVVSKACDASLLSDERLTAGGTLIEAWGQLQEHQAKGR
jgi:transposase